MISYEEFEDIVVNTLKRNISSNEDQKKAISSHANESLFIVAGPGSGKTTVIVLKILKYIFVDDIAPDEILATTFTRKAANELHSRILSWGDQIKNYLLDNIVEDDPVKEMELMDFIEKKIDLNKINIGTTDSVAEDLLRIHREPGTNQPLVIEDFVTKSAMTNILLKDNIYLNENLKEYLKSFTPKEKLEEPSKMAEIILNMKNRMYYDQVNFDEIYDKFEEGSGAKLTLNCIKDYEDELKKRNIIDFPMLEFKFLNKLKNHKLDIFLDNIKIILIDEYQDTNLIQEDIYFTIAEYGLKNNGSITVVGDDDQSIYKFRGANVKNILNFENVFPEAVTIKLEQNYRSTKNILNAANEVIKHNKGRKTKKLWTENEEGDLIEFHQYGTEYEEARKIIHEIEDLSKEGYDYKNMAILYRTNAQSRVFEESFMIKNIPYRIVGGTNFYQRKEVKDILSYLKVVDNGLDDLAVRRIINVPRRGIGAATIEKIDVYAVEHNISFLDACFSADHIETLGNAKKKINGFADLIRDFRRKMEEGSLEELFKYITEETGYIADLKAEETEEAEGRIENINELLNKVVTYEQEAEEASLSELLEEIALVADIDNLEDSDNRVVLMTLHSAKGLEFPYVFICGMEDGIFPSYMTVMSENDDDMEEERRLCYVGITRAKKKLYLSAAKRRMMQGRTQFNKVSRFIDEIPEQLLQLDKGINLKEKRPDKALFSANRGHKFRKPYQAKSFTSTKMDTLSYSVGDMVKHIKFGKGKVLEIVPGGRDYEVTVDFEKVGVKKMFASFAKLKKVE